MAKSKFSSNWKKWIGLGPGQTVVAIVLFWAVLIFLSVLEVGGIKDLVDDSDKGPAILFVLPVIVLVATALVRSLNNN
jgi:hypothetical protein